MRVAVTGGCGRLGELTCRELVTVGHDVLAVDSVYRRDLPCPVVVSDLRNREACYDWLAGAEAVVHLANHPNRRRGTAQWIYTENCAMNINVFQAACEVGVKKIVFASSVQVMGGDPDPGLLHAAPLQPLPFDGTEAVDPENAYGLSKAAGEQMLAYCARRFDLEAVALRFPLLIFDEGQLFFNALRAQRSEMAWLLLFGADGARLIAACLSTALPGFRSYLPAMRENLFQLSPRECIKNHYPDYPLKMPLEELSCLVDISRITRETGWAPAPAQFTP